MQGGVAEGVWCFWTLGLWARREIPERNHGVNSTCWRPFRASTGKLPKPLAAQKLTFFRVTGLARMKDMLRSVCSCPSSATVCPIARRGCRVEGSSLCFGASLSSLSATLLPPVCHTAIVPLRPQSIVFSFCATAIHVPKVCGCSCFSSYPFSG